MTTREDDSETRNRVAALEKQMHAQAEELKMLRNNQGSDRKTKKKKKERGCTKKNCARVSSAVKMMQTHSRYLMSLEAGRN